MRHIFDSTRGDLHDAVHVGPCVCNLSLSIRSFFLWLNNDQLIFSLAVVWPIFVTQWWFFFTHHLYFWWTVKFILSTFTFLIWAFPWFSIPVESSLSGPCHYPNFFLLSVSCRLDTIVCDFGCQYLWHNCRISTGLPCILGH